MRSAALPLTDPTGASGAGREAASGAVEAPAAGFGPYATIGTEAALHAFLAGVGDCGCLAIDTETDGLDAMRARLVGLSLATAAGRAAYLPLRHEVLDPSRCRSMRRSPRWDRC